MTDTPQSKYETTWWEHVGWTEWVDTPNGGRSKTSRFRCIATGEERLAPDLPCGALYALDRSECADRNSWPPAAECDGKAVVCVCVYNGWVHHWHIDWRASNCTKKDDRDHRCWVRHGTVGERVTVDKSGNTCAAGAGSFFMGKSNEWHGFLRNGVLTP